MTYKTSLDKTAVIITSATTVLFAALIIGQYSLITNEGLPDPIYTTTGCLLIYSLTFAFRPVNYRVTHDELIVTRPVFNVRIKKADIKTVELIKREKLRCSIRTFGVGGMFGYYGYFVNFALGKMTWYATRRDRAVLIRTVNGKKIILTPNEPDKFVTEFTVIKN
jgi:hypothetical protein